VAVGYRLSAVEAREHITLLTVDSASPTALK
jgi:hypothetical protein